MKMIKFRTPDSDYFEYKYIDPTELVYASCYKKGYTDPIRVVYTVELIFKTRNTILETTDKAVYDEWLKIIEEI